MRWQHYVPTDTDSRFRIISALYYKSFSCLHFANRRPYKCQRFDRKSVTGQTLRFGSKWLSSLSPARIRSRSNRSYTFCIVVVYKKNWLLFSVARFWDRGCSIACEVYKKCTLLSANQQKTSFNCIQELNSGEL